MGTMLSACVGDVDPAGPDGTWSEALAPEPDTLDSQGSFELAAPEWFAAVELRTHATDSGELATARVAIVDEGGEPVSGVAVYGAFTAGVHVDAQARTDATGVAYFESALSSDAQAGFEVELIGYEVGGELAYVRPYTIDLADFATFVEHDGIAEGISTSSGIDDTATEGDTTDNGISTSSGVDDTTTEEETDNGISTSSGADGSDDGGSSRTADEDTSTSLTADETDDAPDTKGISTSSG